MIFLKIQNRHFFLSKETFWELHLYAAMFLTLECSVVQEHTFKKIKYHEYHLTNLNETQLVDKIYDFKSYYVLNLIF